MGYEPRPLIRITPPQDASDRRVKVFNFVEAIKSLPTNFSKAEFQLIMAKVNPRLYGSLRETFHVLHDDLERVNTSARSRPTNVTETGANSVALGTRGSKRNAAEGSSRVSKSARS